MIRVSGMALLNDSNVITHRVTTSTCHNARVGPELIISRLRAIRQPRMRVLALVSALGEGDPVAWVEALAAIIARAHVVDDPDAIEALETLTHAVAEPSLGYDTKKRLYVAASERNLPAVARLFLDASPPGQL